LLRVEHLQVGDLPPLTFEVAEGECLAVEGPSGVGKSRLLRAIADLEPAAGQVFFDGAERNEMAAPEWRRRVRYSGAEPAWWTDTARPAFPQTNRLDRLIGSVGLEASLLDRPIAVLSTGERQRLALVRALIDEPKVLLLDEPTTGLDPQAAALVEELIRFHVLSGGTALLVSHDSSQIERLAHARLLLPNTNGAAPTGERAA
jgi:ABC-type multidrug transport system ATPase subunit